MNIYHIKQIKIYKTMLYHVPGSKSITNRILFTLLMNKPQQYYIINYLSSEDTITMINILKQFKYSIHYNSQTINIINKQNIITNTPIYLCNAGTVARPILTYLSLYQINYNITLLGHKRLYNRPITELINIIKIITNNKIIYNFIINNNCFPLSIKTHNKFLIKTHSLYIKNIKSSQYITSLLLCIPPLIKNYIIIYLKNIVSTSYILMTIKIMMLCNIKILKYNTNKNLTIIIKKSNYHNTNLLFIDTDCTTLSYYIIRAILSNNKLIIINTMISIKQNELKLIKLYKYTNTIFKLTTTVLIIYNTCHTKNKKYLKINIIDIPDSSMMIPSLILNKYSIIKLYGTKTWHYKESNRTKSITKELKKLHIKTFKGKNWIIFIKHKKIYHNNLLINTYNDHRINMVLSQFGHIININIVTPNCVKKTYPTFIKEITK